MNILSYRDFLREKNSHSVVESILKYSRPGWGKAYFSSIHEGLGLDGEAVTVDFLNDSPTDVVKLNPPKIQRPTKRATVPVFRGFQLDKNKDRSDFMEKIKKEGALSQEDLEKLISMSFPKELQERKISVIYVTGSSDTLPVRIAEAIRSLYHPKAKIVDVLKKYHGIDPKDIIDWDAYARADDRTKEMIDTYLRTISPEFKGYIKKSSGLQSGGRRLLKQGHDIDDYIISTMAAAEEQWRENFLKDRSINPSVALKFKPAYLFVDDTIIEGSTLRGIFREMMSVVASGDLDVSYRNMMKGNIFGYCLFTYPEKELNVDQTAEL
jgi:hypothetical protein